MGNGGDGIKRLWAGTGLWGWWEEEARLPSRFLAQMVDFPGQGWRRRKWVWIEDDGGFSFAENTFKECVLLLHPSSETLGNVDLGSGFGNHQGIDGT